METDRVQVSQASVTIPRGDGVVVLIASGYTSVQSVCEGNIVFASLSRWTPGRESHALALLHDEFVKNWQNKKTILKLTIYEYGQGSQSHFCAVLLCGPAVAVTEHPKQKHKCNCPIQMLLSDGCKCGGI